MAGASIEELQSQIGYEFKNPQLLLESLTHSSRAQESGPGARDNEKLEFLGDAVLNFIVSVRLAEAFPEDAEGKLSRARARLIAADHLAGVAAKLRLGEYLLLGRGEEKTGGRGKTNLQVDALEAIIAALYRDGGLGAAQCFIEKYVLPENLASRGEELFSTDYKSALQEFLQAGNGAPAEYRVIDESGPEHQKTFTVEATVEDVPPCRGSGGSKKSAEQQAARVMLEQLGRKV
ncbi:MAG: ribonuclease III [Acidobacteria bacterium]|nr:ribonuclease III [Acidobacteriota bacterium]